MKRSLIYLLLFALLNLQVFAQTGNDRRARKEAARVAKLKAAINQIGLGDTAPIEMKLKAGGKLIGYVSEMREQSLTFAETSVARSHELAFSEVKEVKSYVPKNPRNWGLILGLAVLGVSTFVAIKACQAAKKRGETCEAPNNMDW